MAVDKTLAALSHGPAAGSIVLAGRGGVRLLQRSYSGFNLGSARFLLRRQPQILPPGCDGLVARPRITAGFNGIGKPHRVKNPGPWLIRLGQRFAQRCQRERKNRGIMQLSLSQIHGAQVKGIDVHHAHHSVPSVGALYARRFKEGEKPPVFGVMPRVKSPQGKRSKRPVHPRVCSYSGISGENS